MTDTAEQSVSLHDQLSQVYDDQATDEIKVVDTDEPKSERARDETGRFIRAENEPVEEEPKEAKQEEAEEEETEVVEEPQPGLEAPQHWSAEDKASFSKLQKEGQEFVLRRYKSMEADYTRKTQEIADTKRFKDNVDQLLNPYRQQFAMHGLDEVGAVRYLLGWYSSLQQSPAQTIQRLAADYGVSLNQKQDENSNIDPSVKPLLDKINSLESQIAQDKQAQHQQVSSNLFEQVKTFSEEKDSTGNLKHPHFEKVRQDMSVLIGSGRAKTLAEAYELSVRLHPDIYDKSLEQSILDKQKAAEQKALDEQKKKAAQAKKAATGIRSGSASVEKQGSKTLRDQLSDLYDRQATS
jgi:hypothetical protein